ncbi:hypothetical protein [Hymenobacter sp. YC55]|uniref:plasmid mobilization protein n=1 Tax=Hymenobacter sp. YC55 TaxID=3034019 RepID=UPI0023F7C70F|nr:hypothetical protein [Hymenobacter sp. YC55]MDF7813933.1 hypothetical protein [Hymenobacter sp. YC55]
MKPDQDISTPATTARTLRIDVRVSPNEKKELQEKAKAAGYKKVSAYLREVGRGTEIKESVPAELHRQLVAIGTDLHQLTELAQSGKAFSNHQAQLAQVLSLIHSCLI